LQSLPETRRAALILRLQDDMSYEETASTLQFSVVVAACFAIGRFFWINYARTTGKRKGSAL
jgi:hypothetical protein